MAGRLKSTIIGRQLSWDAGSLTNNGQAPP